MGTRNRHPLILLKNPLRGLLTANMCQWQWPQCVQSQADNACDQHPRKGIRRHGGLEARRKCEDKHPSTYRHQETIKKLFWRGAWVAQ